MNLEGESTVQLHEGPRVSVCVPTYNRSSYLRQAMDSVLKQTFGDFELLVVDNASTDDTATVVSGYRNPRVRYHCNESNLGMVGNWNKCLELARGEFIAILHDDDLWLPRFLEHMVAALDSNPEAGFAYCPCYFVDEVGTHIGEASRTFSTDCYIESRTLFGMLVQRSGGFSNPGVLVRRRCYAAVGLYDDTLIQCADWDMWLRLSFRFDAAYIAEPLTCYRMHTNSISKKQASYPILVVQDSLRTIEKALELITPSDKTLRDKARREVAGWRMQLAWQYRLGGRRRDALRATWDAVRVWPATALRPMTGPLSLLMSMLLPGRVLQSIRHAGRLAQERGL